MAKIWEMRYTVEEKCSDKGEKQNDTKGSGDLIELHQYAAAGFL